MVTHGGAGRGHHPRDLLVLAGHGATVPRGGTPAHWISVEWGAGWLHGHMSIPQVSVSPTSHDDAVMLDVREQDEWDAGHAPGAVHIPLGELPARLDELPDTDDGTLAVVCRSGGRSARAVAWLLAAGLRRGQPVDGGMKAWEGAGKPLVADSGAASRSSRAPAMAWFGRRNRDDEAAPEPQVEERNAARRRRQPRPERPSLRPFVDPLGDDERGRIAAALEGLAADGVDVGDLASIGAGLYWAYAAWAAADEDDRPDHAAIVERYAVGDRRVPRPQHRPRLAGGHRRLRHATCR